jgi:hypothetical protein
VQALHEKDVNTAWTRFGQRCVSISAVFGKNPPVHTSRPYSVYFSIDIGIKRLDVAAKPSQIRGSLYQTTPKRFAYGCIKRVRVGSSPRRDPCIRLTPPPPPLLTIISSFLYFLLLYLLYIICSIYSAEFGFFIVLL